MGETGVDGESRQANVGNEEHSDGAALAVVEIHRESREGEGTSINLNQHLDTRNLADDHHHDDISSSQMEQGLDKGGEHADDSFDLNCSPLNAHLAPGSEGKELNKGGQPARDATEQSYSPRRVPSRGSEGIELSVPSDDSNNHSYAPHNAVHVPSQGSEAKGNNKLDSAEITMKKTANRDKHTNLSSVSKRGSSTGQGQTKKYMDNGRNVQTSSSREATRVSSTASSPIAKKTNKRLRLADDGDGARGNSDDSKRQKTTPPRETIDEQNEDIVAPRTHLTTGTLNASHDDSDKMEICNDSTEYVELENAEENHDRGEVILGSGDASVVAEERNVLLCCDSDSDESLREAAEKEESEGVQSDHDSHSKNESERVKSTKKDSKARYDIRRLLIESVLGQGRSVGAEAIDDLLKSEPKLPTENQQCATDATALPLRFSFSDDHEPKEPEMTEQEKENAELFGDLLRCWAISELKAFNYPEPKVDKRAARPLKEPRSDRCRRGHHNMVLRDDEGLVCVYCNHVELGPKDIMPQWASKTHRSSYERRRKHEADDLPSEIDGANLVESLPNVAPSDSNFIANEGSTVWSIKPGIREAMYEHQREGFEFLWKNLAGTTELGQLKKKGGDVCPRENVGGCIISHAPGTGKSRLTIVFLETYMKIFPDCRPIIIAPASMLLTWEEEFRKWNVEFPFLNLNSNDSSSDLEREIASKLLARGGAKRHNMETIRMLKLYAWDKGRSILGMSYSLFEKLTWLKDADCSNIERAEALREIFFERPGLVILDEGHTPRNHRSNIWNVLRKLHTEKRVVLSGTPFQNNFTELFNTLRIVRPSLANVLAQEKIFCNMISSRGKRKTDFDDGAVERLKASMVPFVHVHKGTILRKNLPGLKDCVVLLKPPALQKSLIERLEGATTTFEFEHKVALISVHPHLYYHGGPQLGPEVARAVAESRLNPSEGCKTRFVVELIRLSSAVDEKVLIFSQYIQPLDLIRDQLKEVFGWSDGRHILQMQGSLDQKQRQVLINIFNDPSSDSRVMLASTRCCSEGISLVGASRVVLLDVLWNPSVERQAICRAYRIGQKKVVYTYHLMTLGTTEADKYCRQAEKERLSELVFTSSSNEGNRDINNNSKHCGSSSAAQACMEDGFLEIMVGHPRSGEMFEKIINQPKDANLIETFGLTS